jgi:uncharacterized protein (DUF2147 family)
MMKFVCAGALLAGVLSLATAASAATAADMAGKWKWTDYTVECKEGGANGVTCTVTSGPKNVGMEMVQSKLEPKDGAFVGDIKHPANGDTYKTKIILKDKDTWALDGCTAGGVCASGTFSRVK